MEIRGMPPATPIAPLVQEVPAKPARKPRAPRKPPEPGTCVRSRKTGTLEMVFLSGYRLNCPGLPEPKQNYVFSTDGKGFHADFAWEDAKLLVEIEGGIFTGGKHGRGAGIMIDAEKSRHAAASGWRLFRVTAACMGSEAKQQALFALLRKALAYRIPG